MGRNSKPRLHLPVTASSKSVANVKWQHIASFWPNKAEWQHHNNISFLIGMITIGISIDVVCSYPLLFCLRNQHRTSTTRRTSTTTTNDTNSILAVISIIAPSWPQILEQMGVATASAVYCFEKKVFINMKV